MLADEHDRQRDYTLRLGEACLKREDRAAWFDGQNCSLDASIGSLIYEPNTVQNGSFYEQTCSGSELHVSPDWLNSRLWRK
jgi:hypothetical protein